MPIRHPIRITLAGLALGLAFDRLLVNQRLGAGFPLFIVLLFAALALALSWERAEPSGAVPESAVPGRLTPLRQNLWIFVPVLFFAVMTAVRANEFVTFLNVVSVLVLLCVIAIYLMRRSLTTVNLPGYALSPLLAPVMASLRGAQTSRGGIVVAGRAWQGEQRRSWTPLLRGVLLASPVVLIFALLLSSADLMFAEVLRRILPVDVMTFIQNLVTHGIVVLGVGFLLLGGLAYTVWRDEKGQDPSSGIASLTVAPVLGLTESAIVLNAVNLLFAAFVLIQIPYLFGGQLNIDLGHTTYAEYARRGFGELVVVSVLVLGMLLILGALTRRVEPRQRVIFNVSSTITVVLTLVMLVSAFKRLGLYEMAYGFTEMRIYPHVFMIWLGLLLGWFVVTLWFKPGSFAIGLVVVCIGFVATLDVMNVDAFIAGQNVRRYEQLGASAFKYRETYTPDDDRIDTAYLTRLSDDALPALVEGVGRLWGQPKWNVEAHLEKRFAVLRRDLGEESWSSFHLSQWLAYRSLAAALDPQH